MTKEQDIVTIPSALNYEWKWGEKKNINVGQYVKSVFFNQNHLENNDFSYEIICGIY